MAQCAHVSICMHMYTLTCIHVHVRLSCATASLHSFFFFLLICQGTVINSTKIKFLC